MFSVPCKLTKCKQILLVYFILIREVQQLKFNFYKLSKYFVKKIYHVLRNPNILLRYNLWKRVNEDSWKIATVPLLHVERVLIH